MAVIGLSFERKKIVKLAYDTCADNCPYAHVLTNILNVLSLVLYNCVFRILHWNYGHDILISGDFYLFRA